LKGNFFFWGRKGNPKKGIFISFLGED